MIGYDESVWLSLATYFFFHKKKFKDANIAMDEIIIKHILGREIDESPERIKWRHEKLSDFYKALGGKR